MESSHYHAETERALRATLTIHRPVRVLALSLSAISTISWWFLYTQYPFVLQH